LRLLNNGEKRVLGVEAVCFRLKRLFGNCSAIVRIVQKIAILSGIEEMSGGKSWTDEGT
jgi:hypothetical protein